MDAALPTLFAIGVAVTAAFLAYRRHGRGSAQKRESRPHGFAAIRVLYPDELRPHYGVYLPGREAILGYVVFVCWFTTLASSIAFGLFHSRAVLPIAAVAAVISGFATYTDCTSKCIIGPDSIAYVSPVPFLSWSIPLSLVSRCELVPGKPHNRLRVCTTNGSRFLPLTAALWDTLTIGYA